MEEENKNVAPEEPVVEIVEPSVETPVETAPVEPVAVAEPVAPQPAEPVVPVTPEQPTTPVEPPKKKGKGLIIVLVLLLLAGVGFALWFFVLGGNGTKNEAKREEKQEEKKEEKKEEENKQEEENKAEENNQSENKEEETEKSNGSEKIEENKTEEKTENSNATSNKVKSIACDYTTTAKYDDYSNYDMVYNTLVNMEKNEVMLQISVMLVKTDMSDEDVAEVETKLKAKLCSETFSNAKLCQSSKGNKVILFLVQGTMNQVFKVYGDRTFDYDNVKQYLTTVEHMTCRDDNR